MENSKKLKHKLCKEVDEIAMKSDLSHADVDLLYKLTDIIKNIDKIEILEGSEDSHADGGSYRSGRRGSYDGGSNASMRRGAYSYADDDMSCRRGGRYSRSESKDEMLEKIGEMMTGADEHEREVLKKAMRQLEQI